MYNINRRLSRISAKFATSQGYRADFQIISTRFIPQMNMHVIRHRLSELSSVWGGYD